MTEKVGNKGERPVKRALVEKPKSRRLSVCVKFGNSFVCYSSDRWRKCVARSVLGISGYSHFLVFGVSALYPTILYKGS